MRGDCSRGVRERIQVASLRTERERERERERDFLRGVWTRIQRLVVLIRRKERGVRRVEDARRRNVLM